VTRTIILGAAMLGFLGTVAAASPPRSALHRPAANIDDSRNREASLDGGDRGGLSTRPFDTTLLGIVRRLLCMVLHEHRPSGESTRLAGDIEASINDGFFPSLSGRCGTNRRLAAVGGVDRLYLDILSAVMVIILIVDFSAGAPPWRSWIAAASPEPAKSRHTCSSQSDAPHQWRLVELSRPEARRCVTPPSFCSAEPDKSSARSCSVAKSTRVAGDLDLVSPTPIAKRFKTANIYPGWWQEVVFGRPSIACVIALRSSGSASVTRRVEEFSTAPW